MGYSRQEAYDIGQRLALAQPGVDFDDLDITGEASDLVNYIDETEQDYLAVDLEKGFFDARLRTPKYDPPQD
jgi:hypothetical protein